MERNKAIDSTKFLLIVLVVFAHALEVCRDTDWLSEKVYVFIYTFHMPAFIILSGYFFKDRDKSKFWKGVVNLLLTYSFFQVALCGNPLTYSVLNGPVISQLIDGVWYNITHFYEPTGALWYILALAFWRIMLHFIPNNFRENKAGWVMVIACVVSIISGFIPWGRELSFQRTFAFFPYFLLGFYTNHFDGYLRLRKINVLYAWGVVVLFCVILLVIGHFPLSMLVQFFHYSELGNPIIGLCMRVVSYLWMLPLTLAILRLFADVSIFYKQGKNTLFYYIYHMYAIMGMRIVLYPIEGGVKLIQIVLASGIILLLLYGLSKIRILYKPLAFLKVK